MIVHVSDKHVEEVAVIFLCLPFITPAPFAMAFQFDKVLLACDCHTRRREHKLPFARETLHVTVVHPTKRFQTPILTDTSLITSNVPLPLVMVTFLSTIKSFLEPSRILVDAPRIIR